MTRNEALERAQKIWGPGARIVVSTEDRYTVEINRGDMHILDGNGHATCHKRCEQLEAKKCVGLEEIAKTYKEVTFDPANPEVFQRRVNFLLKSLRDIVDELATMEIDVVPLQAGIDAVAEDQELEIYDEA